MQRQPVIHQYRRLLECERFSELPSCVAYSQCMRSHGLPNFPDPASGVPPKVTAQELGVSSSRLQVAQGACQHLLPATGGSLTASSLQQCYLAGVCPQALVQQALSAGREFAQCMRSHGAPTGPTPPSIRRDARCSTSTSRVRRRRRSAPRAMNARAWIPRARCWPTGEIVSGTVARGVALGIVIVAAAGLVSAWRSGAWSPAPSAKPRARLRRPRRP